MTNIQIYSDLHVEFGNKTHPEDCLADYVINAGDFSNTLEDIPRMRNLHENSKIIYVAGNHEFYGYVNPDQHYVDLINKCAIWGINFLQNEIYVDEEKKLVFIGATLWTDYNLYGNAKEHVDAFYRLNDCRFIKGLTSEYCINQFKFSLQYISENIILYKEKGYKVIVVTHHGVSDNSVHEKYKQNSRYKYISAAFSSDLDNFILEHQPNLWVHGHTHDSFDYFIGNTRVVVNPKGYESYSGQTENSNFNKQLVVKV